MSPAEQGELGRQAGSVMSSGDMSHPIPSSPTRPCGLAGRAHSRTPHVAHPGAHTLDKHSHSAHIVPHDLHTQLTRIVWVWSPTPRSTLAVTLTAQPLVYTHTGTCISKWTYTVIHVRDMPLGGPHTLLHKAVVCVSHPVTGSGSHPQAIGHRQVVSQVGQEP